MRGWRKWPHARAFTAMLAVVLSFGASGKAQAEGSRMQAVYLGVENYGAEEVNKDNKENFRYRFEIGGSETILSIDNGIKNELGKYDYPIQNCLKEGYSYEITVEDGMVTGAVELVTEEAPAYDPPVRGEPGKRTLRNFLATALMPVGTTLYIYGGGWDWQDEGSAVQSRTIGVSPDWVRFFRAQDENYTYRDRGGDRTNRDPAHSYYPYGGYNEYYYAGLDCSGYVGWVIYNTMHTESQKPGYVGDAAYFAKRLSEYGWGEWTQNVPAADGSGTDPMKPGDIMSINGHVWISLGTCPDGSVVILHSTASAKSRTGQPGGGVEIAAIGASEDCEAYRLADYYMSNCYPEWYRRYPADLKDPDTYFSFEGDVAGRFRWETSGQSDGLIDPDGYQEKEPGEILLQLFGEMLI